MKLITCLVSLVIALSTSCGGAQPPPAAKTAFACATVDIGQTVPEIGMTIFQDVMAIIQAGADGWVGKLAEIGLRYGEDALACAAKAVYVALTAQQPGAGSGAQTTAPTAAAIRAKTYIDTRAYKYQ